ncbi:MAG: nickel pincer cofactor biosynthesis protein LarC [Desulfobacterales bacterium]|nr:nickel pincer cofactor biosynthesis protein LarC [Desulfobacterales bacterium]
MSKIAYFDCFSGISGDMVLGAFVDMGVPVSHLVESLSRLPLAGFGIAESRVTRHGIGAADIQVSCDEPAPSRNYSAISKLILSSPLSERVKRISLAVFEKIADAEAAIHGCDKATVHFHEVGGIDAVVDIVGAALCVEYLNLHRIIGSKVPLGRGFVSSRHGTLPLPAPATVAILKNIPVYGIPVDCELVTPTGAAILATLCEGFQEFPDMTVEKIGYGAGKKEITSQPNLLRIVVGRETRRGPLLREDHVLVVEAAIDDMNPEIYGYLMERLLGDGALDVYWTPIQMKKNRPGTLVTVLCTQDLKQTVIDRILSETTTLGVRSYPVERHVLAREVVTLNTAFGPVDYKRVSGPDGTLRLVPEFEACKRIAVEKNRPLKEIYRLVSPPV